MAKMNYLITNHKTNSQEDLFPFHMSFTNIHKEIQFETIS